MTDSSLSTARLASWLDHRIDLSIGFHMPAARLYGIVVNDLDRLDDDHAAARTSFITEDRDTYALLTGSAAVLARSFDAAAVVTTGWAAPMLPDGSMTHRPSRHPERRRVRAVAVVDSEGVASVLRFEDQPEVSTAMPTGDGAMVEALVRMWHGLDADIVNLRTTRGPCARRP